MKKYNIPTTEIYQISANIMIDMSPGVGEGEYANKTEFDEASELEIDMKQNLWDD